VSQVGALLRSHAADNPLRGLPVADEYLTGYSQTGGYEVTYVNAIAPHFVSASGSPIFDGYLIGAGYGFVVPINQCTPPPAPGSDKWIVHPPGNAPVIDGQTQSDSYALRGILGSGLTARARATVTGCTRSRGRAMSGPSRLRSRLGPPRRSKLDFRRTTGSRIARKTSVTFLSNTRWMELSPICSARSGTGSRRRATR
jgi:hypothetical protein